MKRKYKKGDMVIYSYGFSRNVSSYRVVGMRKGCRDEYYDIMDITRGGCVTVSKYNLEHLGKLFRVDNINNGILPIKSFIKVVDIQ